MKWNWQLADWPNFKYEPNAIQKAENDFLHYSGIFFGAYNHLDSENIKLLKIELISNEAIETSEIEGEYLDRESVQSSIRKHFGLKANVTNPKPSEQGIASLMLDLYQNYQHKLDDTSLFKWHTLLMSGRKDLAIGSYRTGVEPMQIISGPIHRPIIHFEAPPSNMIAKEMNHFVNWFNQSYNQLPAITRAAIAHLYFESIHPFEDGNGRIGRAIAEKALAQGLGKPTLIALSTVINKHKKAYYAALASASKSNNITPWLEYFADITLQATNYSKKYAIFLLEKTRLLNRIQHHINPRQEKCLIRMFKEGPDGFRGGLSAENYISITQTSKATATRDLADLVEKGALTKKGSLRYSRYYLNIAT